MHFMPHSSDYFNRLDLTLPAIVTDLSIYVGWDKMAEKIPINCFMHEPGIKSSVAFLRKIPWARRKVEVMYEFNLKTLREGKRVKVKANLFFY